MIGVSEVIAIILILMITISLAGLAYMFMSTTMIDVTASAGSTVDTTTTSMLTSFTIESIDVAKVHVRNTGQSTLTSLSVYVDDQPATYVMIPTSIDVGVVGTITIYSFIPDGATVKITSANGFSASKIAQPCSKAIGCWKFDEGTGNVAYDSSPYGNTGTLVNGTSWTSGLYSNALLFDGTNDYVNCGYSDAFNLKDDLTLEALVKLNSLSGTNTIVSKTDIIDSASSTFWIDIRDSGNTVYFGGYTQGGSAAYVGIGYSFSVGTWYHILGVDDGRNLLIYINGDLVKNGTRATRYYGEAPVTIGSRRAYGINPFNGTIDEVRIYNRAIY